MEENDRERRVTPSDDCSHSWEAEMEILTGLAAWIGFEVVLSSENRVIPGSQWGGSEWSLMGVSQAFTEGPSLREPNWSSCPWVSTGAHSLPSSPSSFIALVCSAQTADLNCKCSFNKWKYLDTTLLFINFHSI